MAIQRTGYKQDQNIPCCETCDNVRREWEGERTCKLIKGNYFDALVDYLDICDQYTPKQHTKEVKQ